MYIPIYTYLYKNDYIIIRQIYIYTCAYIPEKGGNESQQPPNERVICYIAKGSGEGCGAGP